LSKTVVEPLSVAKPTNPACVTLPSLPQPCGDVMAMILQADGSRSTRGREPAAVMRSCAGPWAL
jgi:hypothetical protein